MVNFTMTYEYRIRSHSSFKFYKSDSFNETFTRFDSLPEAMERVDTWKRNNFATPHFLETVEIQVRAVIKYETTYSAWETHNGQDF